MKNLFKKLFPFLYKGENEINKKLDIINSELFKLRKEVEEFKTINNLKKINNFEKEIQRMKDLIKYVPNNKSEILSYDLKGYESKLTSKQRTNLIKRNNPDLLKDLNNNN